MSNVRGSDRRKAPRIPVGFNIWVGQGNTPMSEGIVKNLSFSGLFFDCDCKLNIGDEIGLFVTPGSVMLASIADNVHKSLDIPTNAIIRRSSDLNGKKEFGAEFILSSQDSIWEKIKSKVNKSVYLVISLLCDFIVAAIILVLFRVINFIFSAPGPHEAIIMIIENSAAATFFLIFIIKDIINLLRE